MSDHIPPDSYAKCIGEINPHLAEGGSIVFPTKHLLHARRVLDLSANYEALDKQSIKFDGDDPPPLNELSCEYAGNVLKILDQMGIPVYTKETGFGVVASGSSGIPVTQRDTRVIPSLVPGGDDLRVPKSKDFDIFLVAPCVAQMKALIKLIYTVCKNNPIDPICIKCKRRNRDCFYTTKGFVCPDDECRGHFITEFGDPVYSFEAPCPRFLEMSKSLIWCTFDCDIKLEFVVCRGYKSPLDVIRSFDLPQCQFVYYYSPDMRNPMCEATFNALWCLENRCQIVDPGSASNCIEPRIVKYIKRFPTLVIPCVEKLDFDSSSLITRGLPCVMKLFDGSSNWKDLCMALELYSKNNASFLEHLSPEEAWLYMPPSSYCPLLAYGVGTKGKHYLKISDNQAFRFEVCSANTAQYGSPYSRSFTQGPRDVYANLWLVSMGGDSSNVIPPPVIHEASSSSGDDTGRTACIL